MAKLFCTIFNVALLIGVATCFTIRKNETDTRSKIYGGFLANQIVPYHVMLKTEGVYSCGGSLITLQHVLTAAHCVSKNIANPSLRFTVVAGTINRESGGVEIGVQSIMSHPQYSPTDYFNDIAVLKLTQPFTQSQYIYPIALTGRPVVNEETVTITGFGAYIEKADWLMSQQMKTYSSKVLTNEACYQILPHVIKPSDICDYVVRGHGICFGDSGSPLVNAYNEVVGVASRVMGCGVESPNVYSSVYYNLNFVRTCLSY